MDDRATAVVGSGLKPATVLLREFAGAVVGGAVGIVAFQMLARAGFYGIMLPGAFLGLGAGLAARGKSLPLGIGALFALWFGMGR